MDKKKVDPNIIKERKQYVYVLQDSHINLYPVQKYNDIVENDPRKSAKLTNFKNPLVMSFRSLNSESYEYI